MLRKLAAVGAVATFVVGCAPDKPMPTAGFEIRTPLYAVGGQSGVNMGTHMTGAEEVFTPNPPTAPTPADSRGQGEAIFRVNGDGTVDFRLIASNINNVIMSHIHCGPPGSNGPIRMWLYPVIGPSGAPAPSGGGRQNGVLASGTFTLGTLTCLARDIGTAEDKPLLEAMQEGLTYVNVHTNDGVNPTNTGPGDFPGGEIRGQLDHGR